MDEIIDAKRYQAKKSLGQNFLKSKKVIAEMIMAAEIKEGETVLEIGPGLGVLTEALLYAGAKVVAVEKDRDLIKILREKFAPEIVSEQLDLVEGDIEKWQPEINGLKAGNYKLVANIPYYLTGLIMRKFLSGSCQPAVMEVLIQKEVAQRIMARDGKESLLSLSVKVYGEAKIVTQVDKENFSPQPKVDSAVLLIKNISKVFFKNVAEVNFFKLLKIGFAHKRKTLAGNLKNEFASEQVQTVFSHLQLTGKERAEDLTLNLWLQICFGLFQ